MIEENPNAPRARSVTHTLHTQLRVPHSREAVFPFFSDAFNLERITPPELGFHVLTPAPIEIGEGTRIRYRLRLWGIPFHWETLISCWEPPYRFVDEQLSGPYRLWSHRHEFIPTHNGTLVCDHVEYALPFGVAGELSHPLVRRQLIRIFRYRHEVLYRLFCGDGAAESGIVVDAAHDDVRTKVLGPAGTGDV
jgi:ligand-binding SRPBCC domain-containing protein